MGDDSRPAESDAERRRTPGVGKGMTEPRSAGSGEQGPPDNTVEPNPDAAEAPNRAHPH